MLEKRSADLIHKYYQKMEDIVSELCAKHKIDIPDIKNRLRLDVTQFDCAMATNFADAKLLERTTIVFDAKDYAVVELHLDDIKWKML